MDLGKGEDSNDECCVCGSEWTEGCQGWVLCDESQCPNTVCKSCTATLSLSVGELFYCPQCAGSGESAAAVAGGVVATAVAACSELEKLPLSFKATRRILSNLVAKPDEMKYRKLRLENKQVKNLIDLEPVLNILTAVGFTRKLCDRTVSNINATTAKEEVLILEDDVPIDLLNDLLEIFDGMTNDSNASCRENDCSSEKKSTETPPESGKRKRDAEIHTAPNNDSSSNTTESKEGEEVS